MSLEGAHILITGGAGFIGSNFVRQRRASHPSDRLVVLDALTYAGNLESLADVPGFQLVRGDIYQWRPLMAEFTGKN